MRTHEITNRRPESFVSCRVGLEFRNYHEELGELIAANNIKDKANFIVTPIAPPRTLYYDCNLCETGIDNHDRLHLLPDLVLPTHVWGRQVAVSLGQLPLYSREPSEAIEVFRLLFKHALYLATPVIVVDCPETEDAQRRVASVINQCLRENSSERLILVRLSLGSRTGLQPVSLYLQRNGHSNKLPVVGNHNMPTSRQPQISSMQLDDLNDDSGLGTSSNTSTQEELCTGINKARDDWNIWNDFRSHLDSDHRIGLCLAIDDDLETETEELARWVGEPVRMISLTVDRFSANEGFRNTLRPAGNIREFMRTIALANSLKTSFVVQAKTDVDTQDYLSCLSNFCDMLDQEHPDAYRAWNDTPLSPLQPLSSNLDSNTYQIFEDDIAKYQMYQRAMAQALNSIMTRRSSIGRNKFVIMILGAGRGPLVDAMTAAITRTGASRVDFKIYALDKNYSSIRSLKYKKTHRWAIFLPRIEVEVIEADMRTWQPPEKADIIATELLGSFSDNELSPECIDGTWRFATEQTICIPQSYSSYIAPICSYRMRQELHKSRFWANNSNVYDQLRVVRLSNYYTISQPEKLFTFEHIDVSKEPKEGANRRVATLRFFSKVDTVCHGFAGYFSANLFGSVKISTLPSIKTPNMESWFSTFIPLDRPIQMPANTSLEVKFNRNESHDRVWYEWIVIKPEMSRIHSHDGDGSAMSKLI